MLDNLGYKILSIIFVCAVAAAFYGVSADTATAPPLNTEIGTISEAQNRSKDIHNSQHKILFTGDVLLARAVEWAMDAHGSNYPYKHIADTFMDHSEVVVNFEASIPEVHQQTPAFKLAFSVDQEHIAALNDAGVTHASLANNHSYDYRRAGYDNSVMVLAKNNIKSFGKPYTLATSTISFIKGVTDVALIGIDLTQSTYTTEELVPIFTYAEENSDLQVVVVHWGTEYDMTHSSVQEQSAKLFVELGADLVVGHHPHVVQDIAFVDSVPVFYSLGNLVFDQYFSDEVQKGLMLSWDVQFNTIKLIPVTSIGSRNQPRLMPEQERRDFLDSLAGRSASELRNEIRNGAIPFRQVVQ